jgi:hypothetical protein
MKKVLAFILVLAVVLSASVVSYPFFVNNSVSLPFEYQLSVFPINGTAMQGETIETNITVTYLQGQPQPVTLAATNNSTFAQINLSNATGIPRPNEPYISNLTIQILDSAQSSILSINVTGNSNNKNKYSTAYSLEILNSQIQISGTVSTPSKIASIYPIKLQFVNLKTNITYNATLQYPSLPKASTLQQQAIYNISLPNQQTYRVIGTWGRLYGPWSSSSDLPEGTFDCGILQVDCRVGETTINKDYYK